MLVENATPQGLPGHDQDVLRDAENDDDGKRADHPGYGPTCNAEGVDHQDGGDQQAERRHADDGREDPLAAQDEEGGRQ